MRNTLEYQGKNVEQALQAASDELKIPVEKLKHEVIAYGSSGIFGLVGVKKAKIKVFVHEPKPAVDRSKSSVSDPATPPPDQDVPGPQKPESTGPPKYDQSLVENGVLALEKIINGISSGAEVSVDQKKEKLFFRITGGDSGVLIGKRGQTLEAIQYLLEKMINIKSTTRVRVVVDVEGYLEKRKINLKQMAARMAEKARRTQKPVTIGQMNAHDRRIVHIHLKDDKGVRTQSIGEGYYRKLMIFPKKKGGSRRNNKDA